MHLRHKAVMRIMIFILEGQRKAAISLFFPSATVKIECTVCVYVHTSPCGRYCPARTWLRFLSALWHWHTFFQNATACRANISPAGCGRSILRGTGEKKTRKKDQKSCTFLWLESKRNLNHDTRRREEEKYRTGWEYRFSAFQEHICPVCGPYSQTWTKSTLKAM